MSLRKIIYPLVVLLCIFLAPQMVHTGTGGGGGEVIAEAGDDLNIYAGQDINLEGYFTGGSGSSTYEVWWYEITSGQQQLCYKVPHPPDQIFSCQVNTTPEEHTTRTFKFKVQEVGGSNWDDDTMQVHFIAYWTGTLTANTSSDCTIYAGESTQIWGEHSGGMSDNKYDYKFYDVNDGYNLVASGLAESGKLYYTYNSPELDPDQPYIYQKYKFVATRRAGYYNPTGYPTFVEKLITIKVLNPLGKWQGELLAIAGDNVTIYTGETVNIEGTHTGGFTELNYTYQWHDITEGEPGTLVAEGTSDQGPLQYQCDGADQTLIKSYKFLVANEEDPYTTCSEDQMHVYVFNPAATYFQAGADPLGGSGGEASASHFSLWQYGDEFDFVPAPPAANFESAKAQRRGGELVLIKDTEQQKDITYGNWYKAPNAPAGNFQIFQDVVHKASFFAKSNAPEHVVDNNGTPGDPSDDIVQSAPTMRLRLSANQFDQSAYLHVYSFNKRDGTDNYPSIGPDECGKNYNVYFAPNATKEYDSEDTLLLNFEMVNVITGEGTTWPGDLILCESSLKGRILRKPTPTPGPSPTGTPVGSCINFNDLGDPIMVFGDADDSGNIDPPGETSFKYWRYDELEGDAEANFDPHNPYEGHDCDIYIKGIDKEAIALWEEENIELNSALGKVYIFEFRIYFDSFKIWGKDQQDCPRFRLRVHSSTFQQAAYIDLQSWDVPNACPIPDEARTYHVVYVPPIHINYENLIDKVNIYFDFILKKDNGEWRDDQNAKLILKWIKIYELDLHDLLFYPKLNVNHSKEEIWDGPEVVGERLIIDWGYNGPWEGEFLQIQENYCRPERFIINYRTDKYPPSPFDPDATTILDAPVPDSIEDWTVKIFEHLFYFPETGDYYFSFFSLDHRDYYHVASFDCHCDLAAPEENPHANDFAIKIPTLSETPLPEAGIITGDVVDLEAVDNPGALSYHEHFSWSFGDGVIVEGTRDDFEQHLRSVRHRFLGEPCTEYQVLFTAQNIEGSCVAYHCYPLKITILDEMIPGCKLDSDKGLQQYTVYDKTKAFIGLCYGLENPIYSGFYHPTVEEALGFDSDGYLPYPHSFRTDPLRDIRSPGSTEDVENPAQNYSRFPTQLRSRHFDFSDNPKIPSIPDSQPTPQPIYQYRERTIWDVDEKESLLKRLDPEDHSGFTADQLKKWFENWGNAIVEVAALPMRSIFRNLKDDVKDLINYDVLFSHADKKATIVGRNLAQHGLTTAGSELPQAYYPGTGGYAGFPGVYMVTLKLGTHVLSHEFDPQDAVADRNGVNPMLKETGFRVWSFNHSLDQKPLDTVVYDGELKGKVDEQDFYDLVRLINFYGDHGTKVGINLFVPPVFSHYCNRHISGGWGDGVAVTGTYTEREFFNVSGTTDEVVKLQLQYLADLMKRFNHGQLFEPGYEVSNGEYAVTKEEARRAYRNLYGLVLLEDPESFRMAGHHTGVHYGFNVKVDETVVYPTPTATPYDTRIDEGHFRLKIRLQKHEDSPKPPILFAIGFVPYYRDCKMYRVEGPQVVIDCGSDSFKKGEEPGSGGPYVIGDAQGWHSGLWESGSLFIDKINVTNESYSPTNFEIDPDLKGTTCYQTYAEANGDFLEYQFYGNFITRCICGYTSNDVWVHPDYRARPFDESIHIRLYFAEPDDNDLDGDPPVWSADRRFTIWASYRGSPLGSTSNTDDVTNPDNVHPFLFDSWSYPETEGLYDPTNGLINILNDAHLYGSDFTKDTINPFLCYYVDEPETTEGEVRLDYRTTYDNDAPVLDNATKRYIVRQGCLPKFIDIFTFLTPWGRMGPSGEYWWKPSGSGTVSLTLLKSQLRQRLSDELSTSSQDLVIETLKDKSLIVHPTSSDYQITQTEYSDWVRKIIETGWDSLPSLRGLESDYDDHHVPVILLSTNPDSENDPLVFERELRGGTPTPTPIPSPEACLLGTETYNAGDRKNVTIKTASSDRYYISDYATNLYAYHKYIGSDMRRWGASEWDWQNRFVWFNEGNLFKMDPQPLHVGLEHRMAELNFRDRALFFALDRHAGYVCSDYEAPIGSIKQMKLISLVFDLIDYPRLRNDYYTLKPSVVVDLTRDWHHVLSNAPPADETASNNRQKAFADLHAWVLWSLNSWVNLDFWINPYDNPHPGHPTDGYWSWFGSEGASSPHPKCVFDDYTDEQSPESGVIDIPSAIDDAKRIIYPYVEAADPEPDCYPFQAKLWVGGTDPAAWEGQGDSVSCVVAYLRAMENEVTDSGLNPPGDEDPPYEFDRPKYYGAEPSYTLCNLQQWRNIDTDTSVVPNLWSDQWELISDLFEPAGSPYFLRRPRPHVDNASHPEYDQLKFTINCNKFASGTDYFYVLISLDKLEQKLHLLSKYPLETPDPTVKIPYDHIQEELSIQYVFSHTDFEHDPPNNLPYWMNDNNPIMKGPNFLPSSGSEDVQVNLLYNEPEGNEERSCSDFILLIYPDSYHPEILPTPTPIP